MALYFISLLPSLNPSLPLSLSLCFSRHLSVSMRNPCLSVSPLSVSSSLPLSLSPSVALGLSLSLSLCFFLPLCVSYLCFSLSLSLPLSVFLGLSLSLFLPVSLSLSVSPCLSFTLSLFFPLHSDPPLNSSDQHPTIGHPKVHYISASSLNVCLNVCIHLTIYDNRRVLYTKNQRDLNQLCTRNYRELIRRLTNSRTNPVLYTPSL